MVLVVELICVLSVCVCVCKCFVCVLETISVFKNSSYIEESYKCNFFYVEKKTIQITRV